MTPVQFVLVVLVALIAGVLVALGRLRAAAQPDPEKPARNSLLAIVALVGLATLWFNFVGINFFFGSGSQHSYAAPEPTAVVRSIE